MYGIGDTVKTDYFEFTLTNVPIIVFYKRADYIVIRYTDKSGKPLDINLVAFIFFLSLQK